MLKRKAKYTRIGQRLINSLPEFGYIQDSMVRIAYLGSDEAKIKNGKIILGECIKVNANYSWCCPFEFMIVIYEPNILEFTDDQLEILIEHELHHVGINNDGNEPKYSIVPHDVEEFWNLIDKYGLRWNENA